MAVTASVIELDNTDTETGLQSALTTLNISLANFVEVVLLQPSGNGKKARIIVFYNV